MGTYLKCKNSLNSLKLLFSIAILFSLTVIVSGLAAVQAQSPPAVPEATPEPDEMATKLETLPIKMEVLETLTTQITALKTQMQSTVASIALLNQEITAQTYFELRVTL